MQEALTTIEEAPAAKYVETRHSFDNDSPTQQHQTQLFHDQVPAKVVQFEMQLLGEHETDFSLTSLDDQIRAQLDRSNHQSSPPRSPEQTRSSPGTAGTHSAFSKAHEGTMVTIKDGRVVVNGFDWTVQWNGQNHPDGSARITAVEDTSLKIKVSLDDGTGFQIPSLDRIKQHSPPRLLTAGTAHPSSVCLQRMHVLVNVPICFVPTHALFIACSYCHAPLR